MQNQMKIDAEIFDADLNENRCKFALQPKEKGRTLEIRIWKSVTKYRRVCNKQIYKLKFQEKRLITPYTIALHI